MPVALYKSVCHWHLIWSAFVPLWRDLRAESYSSTTFSPVALGSEDCNVSTRMSWKFSCNAIKYSWRIQLYWKRSFPPLRTTGVESIKGSSINFSIDGASLWSLYFVIQTSHQDHFSFFDAQSMLFHKKESAFMTHLKLRPFSFTLWLKHDQRIISIEKKEVPLWLELKA